MRLSSRSNAARSFHPWRRKGGRRRSRWPEKRSGSPTPTRSSSSRWRQEALAAGGGGCGGWGYRNRRRRAMLLAAATDLADILSAAIEARARGALDADLRDGIVFSSAGLVSALAAPA